MAYIHTFYGDGDRLDQAISKAEEAAQDFLQDLSADQIVSVQAQTIATPWKTEAATDIKTQVFLEYTHVITVVSTVREGTPKSFSGIADDVPQELELYDGGMDQDDAPLRATGNVP